MIPDREDQSRIIIQRNQGTTSSLAGKANRWYFPHEMSLHLQILTVVPFLFLGIVLADERTQEQPVAFFDYHAFRHEQTKQALQLDKEGKLIPASKLAAIPQKKKLDFKRADVRPTTKPASLTELYRTCQQSVFSMAEVRDCTALGKTLVTPFGTGFAISSEGILLTNYHLIEDPDPLTRLVASQADGTTFAVLELLAASKENDLAILRTNGHGFAALPLSPENPVGTEIAIISHPRGHPYTLSEGVITSLRRRSGKLELYVSADFAIGSSGGPVLDSSGNVLGLVAFTAPLNDQMTFKGCIPTQSVLKLLDVPQPLAPSKYPPFTGDRDRLQATFAAMQDLLKQQAQIPKEQFNRRMTEVNLAMVDAMKQLPDDPISQSYRNFLETMRKKGSKLPGQ